MDKKYSFQLHSVIMDMLKIIAIVSVFHMSMSIFINQTDFPRTCEAAEPITWSVILHISDGSGTGNSVIFGEAPDASDNQDTYDVAAPPMPPQLPAIVAWFETEFPLPFHQLMYEYKKYPSTDAVWNLSLLWIPEPGNTTTMIRIQWNTSEVAQSHYRTFVLLRNNTVLTDMLVDSSYVFLSNGTLEHFQILCQNSSSGIAPQQDDFSMIFLTIGLILVSVLCIALITIFYKRR